jgi:hypothetical protein
MRDDLGIYVRSSWEANYARYLNWLVERKQIAGWAFEAETFEFPVHRGTRAYTPDFKVVELDGGHYYVEVKGHMDERSQVKLARFARYFPYERLELVRGKEMRAIYSAVGALILGWERNENDKLFSKEGDA